MAQSTITSANPGNIVVPLSAIIDQLKGKLSSSEIDALLYALISKRTNEVQPGDLITAQLINQMLKDISDLRIQVAALLSGVSVSSGRPQLLTRNPTGNVSVGSKLTLIGVNFIRPGDRNTVNLGGVEINQFLQANGELLAFQVPDLFPSLPSDMQVFVHNDNGESDTLAVRVLPRPVQKGGKVTIYDQTPTGQPTATGDYTLSFLVDSPTLQTTDYTLELVFTKANGASADKWKERASISPTGMQRIEAGKPLTVTVTGKVPTGGINATATLNVVSLDGVFSDSSPMIFLDATGATPTSDPATTVNLDSSNFPAKDVQTGNRNKAMAADITIDGKSVKGAQVVWGAIGVIPFVVTATQNVKAPGRYEFSAEVEENSTGLWSVPTVNPPDQTMQQREFQTVYVRIINQDSQSSATVKSLIVRAKHFNIGSTTSNFTSYTRIPIQGVTV